MSSNTERLIFIEEQENGDLVVVDNTATPAEISVLSAVPKASELVEVLLRVFYSGYRNGTASVEREKH